MTDEEKVRRGQAAERLLEDPLLKEAFEKIEQEIRNLWTTSPAKDAEGREKLWLSLGLLQRVRLQIHSVVQTGQIAQAKQTLPQRAGLRSRQI